MMTKKTRWTARPRGWMGRPKPTRLIRLPRRLGAIVTLLLGGAAAASPAAAQGRSGLEAWAIEATGGSVGSLVGMGAGVLLLGDDGCEDDLMCIFKDVALVLVTASATSTVGAWGVGKAADTDPSLGWAALGSVLGAAAGLGAIKVAEELDDNGPNDTAVEVIAFSVTQGAITALASRLGAAIR